MTTTKLSEHKASGFSALGEGQPAKVTSKSYTLTMNVWHGSYKNTENATGDSIENALATLIKTSMGIGYGPKLETEQFHDVCRCLSEFGTVTHGWADYILQVGNAANVTPDDNPPDVAAFDASHGELGMGPQNKRLYLDRVRGVLARTDGGTK